MAFVMCPTAGKEMEFLLLSFQVIRKTGFYFEKQEA